MSIAVHALAPPQRRMLLEMLASERAGERQLHIGHHFGRDLTADGLCKQALASHTSDGCLVFTDLGRHVAEHLATRILGRSLAARLAS